MIPFQAYGVVSLFDMLRFYADKYVAITRIFISLSGGLSRESNKKKRVSELNHKFILENLNACSRYLSEIGLPLCAGQAEEIVASIEKDETCERIGDDVFQLYKNFCRELSISVFYQVPREQAKYSDPHEPLFGLGVYERFTSTIVDIEEAGKCLAFGRSTVCVFHLMRIMEAGLKSLAKGLEIPYAPSWESYLRQINTKMASPHAKKIRLWKKNEAFYRDAAGDLEMVKLAWRNPTMHIERTYSVEEAEDIFRAVRVFMKRLSIKFDESGWIKGK
jgi:hypothetical protein